MFALLTVDFVGSFVAWSIAILAIASTLYDVFNRKFEKKPNEMFRTFSIVTNFEQLIKINKTESRVNCIDGIKGISAILIVIGHRMDLVKPSWGGWSSWQQIIMQILIFFPYCVISFFACSGILIAMSLLRSLNRRSLNIAKAYTNRFFRIFPVMALLVLYFLTSMSPDDGRLGTFKNICSTEWKKALLLYQNYNNGYICFDHTCVLIALLRYLSTDIQLFLLSPFIIAVLSKFQKKGAVLVIASIFMLQFYRFLELKANPNRPWWWNYTETHFRLAEFLVGIITGYIIYNEELSEKIEKKLKQNKMLLVICWTFSIGFFWFHIFQMPKLPLSPTARLLYASVERELWACAVCWIVFACHRLQSGGIIRTFLSHPAWQPLSKITLSMYLLHMPYLYYTSPYYPGDYGFLWLVHLHTGDVFFSIIAASFAYVLVEAPVAKLVQFAWNCSNYPQSLGKMYDDENASLIKKEEI